MRKPSKCPVCGLMMGDELRYTMYREPGEPIFAGRDCHAQCKNGVDQAYGEWLDHDTKLLLDFVGHYVQRHPAEGTLPRKAFAAVCRQLMIDEDRALDKYL